MGCAASLPNDALTDKGSLESQKGALRKQHGSQEFGHEVSERSTKASTRSSGAVFSHVQSTLTSIADNEHDALTASNFNEETGAPDMGNGPLRMNLRNTEQWFQNTCSGNPQDFPRLAREFTRRRRRPQASTADDSELKQHYGCDGDATPGGSTRRFSTPVLAEGERFGADKEPSSLETEAAMWRLWSAKDLPLSRSEERNDSKAELDCHAAQDFASLSTCLPQADFVTGDEEMSEHQAFVSVEGPGLVDQLRESLQKALVTDWSCEGGIADDAPKGSPEEVLIMLDWDDTILPTTWLGTRPWFFSWVRQRAELGPLELVDAEDARTLQDMDLAACELLEEAQRLGQVACITLAQRPWVEQSMKAFLPRLAARWEEIGVPVHYAVEEHVRNNTSWCLKSSNPSLLESTVLEMNLRSTQKFKVMRRLMRRFYRSQNYCNAISLGDGLAERNGLKEIAWHHGSLSEESDAKSLQVKTIQMLEDPTCFQLATELKVLRRYLPRIVGCVEDIDTVLGTTLDP